MIRGLLENEDGFSLLEMALSIGMLALLSGFILQMFLISGNANGRAKDMDRASFAAIDAIEEMKACNYANDFLNTDFIVDTRVAFGLSDYFVIDDRLGFNPFDFTRGFTLYKYYDRDWNVLPLRETVSDPEFPEEEHVKFILKFSMEAVEEEDMAHGSLYDVSVKVFEAVEEPPAERENQGDEADGGVDEEDPNALVNYKTKVYFAKAGGLYGY